jgi:hypothetical protein
LQPSELNARPGYGTVNRTFPMRLFLTFSIVLSIVVFCVSAAEVSTRYGNYFLQFNPLAVSSALAVAALFAPVFLLFVVAEFNFGYLVGFYGAAMVLEYLWLSFFSLRSYDFEVARLSAAVSVILFLLPALFLTTPLPRLRDMSVKSFERLLVGLFLVCAATVVVGATYNFRLVSPGDASNLRTDALPPIMKYLIGITSSAVLPFLFAYCIARRAFWQALAVATLMLLYYPVAISKMTFFAPFWLIVISLLARLFGARLAVVLSLLLPIAAGALLFPLIGGSTWASKLATSYFFTVNFRLLAVPSLALDVYNEFFARHEFTYFCQIGLLRIIDCPYHDQLGVVMLNYFPGGGTYNAPLFATEGIASVGVLFAPVTVFLCGIIIALGNCVSVGLPRSFVLVSGGMLAQILLNVPLSVALVTHGGALLLLLWYVTPREIFERQRAAPLDAQSSA